jgi:hypothetical protein
MKDAILRNKTTVMNALAAAGVTSVVAEFDGYGDDGQIHSIEAHSGDATVELPTASVMIVGSDDDEPASVQRVVPFAEAIETLCYLYLENECCGWEIDEGSYGTFTFTVSDGIIELDFTRRASEFYTF